jgi:hypothetical protein
MNGRSVCVAVVVLSGFVFSGCETYHPAYTAPGFMPTTLKKVAVMDNPLSKAKRHIDTDVANVLLRRGIEAVIVPAGTPPPTDIDGYFTYSDKWEWDMTMYLSKLEIQLHDAHTGAVLASASYEQGAIHRYPSPTDIADSLVGQILGEPPPKQRSRSDTPEGAASSRP